MVPLVDGQGVRQRYLLVEDWFLLRNLVYFQAYPGDFGVTRYFWICAFLGIAKGECVFFFLVLFVCLLARPISAQEPWEVPQEWEGTAEVIAGAVHLPGGWKEEQTLSAEYSLVCRGDSYQLMVLDCGRTHPRLIETTEHKNSYWVEFCWSQDGKAMFSNEREKLYRMATGSGALDVLHSTSMTFAILGKSRPRYAKQELFHDGERDRLVYLEKSTSKGGSGRLVALSLGGGEPVVLIDLGCDQVTWGTVALEKGLFYGNLGSAIVVWTLEGKKLRESPLPPAKGARLTLSPDESVLLVEKYVDYGKTSGVDRDKGCWLLSADTLEVRGEIPFGKEFEWASKGQKVAFLRWSEELWTYDLPGQVYEKLAFLKPRPDAPGGSRGSYFWKPAWSADDRMIACRLSRWAAGHHQFENYTIILDLEQRLARVPPGQLSFLSWSPVPRPFEN